MSKSTRSENAFMPSTLNIDDLDDRQLDALARRLRPKLSRLALHDPEQVAADLLLLLGIAAGKIEPALLATGRLTDPAARKQWSALLGRQLLADIDTSPPPPREPAPLLDVNLFRGSRREFAKAINAYASGEARTLPSGVPKAFLREFAPALLAEIERGSGFQKTGKLDDAGDRAPGGIDWQG